MRCSFLFTTPENVSLHSSTKHLYYSILADCAHVSVGKWKQRAPCICDLRVALRQRGHVVLRGGGREFVRWGSVSGILYKLAHELDGGVVRRRRCQRSKGGLCDMAAFGIQFLGPCHQRKYSPTTSREARAGGTCGLRGGFSCGGGNGPGAICPQRLLWTLV